VLVSAFVALTLTPMLCATMLQSPQRVAGHARHGWLHDKTEPLFVALNGGFERLLRAALRHRWLVLGGALAFTVVGCWLYTRLQRELVPTEDRGIFFDLPNFNGFFDNRPGNGAAVGVQANNTGPNPVFTVTQTKPFAIVAGVDPLPTVQSTGEDKPLFGAAAVSKDFRNAYVQNFNVNTEYQLSSRTILQVGYVGSLGRRLFNVRDINQAKPGVDSTGVGSTNQATRPFYSTFPQVAAVNQYESLAGSNYHSLQAMIRTSGWHGVTAQASYTYGHALDNVSGTRGFAPQDSTNLNAEYGNADFDVKHTFNGYVVYEVPKFTEHLPLLTRGWQANTFITFYTGQPVAIKTKANNSGNGEFQDRVDLVGNPTSSDS